MNWIKNLAVVGVSLTVSFLFAEVILRVFNVGRDAPIARIERSEIFHHVHPADYSFRIHAPNREHGQHEIFYDAAGFRVPDSDFQTSEIRGDRDAVIFLGDSFTEANQVVYEDTFVSIVGGDIGKKVVNMGVSSYSPLIYLLQARKVVSKFDAGTVVLQLFSNDFASDISYQANAQIEGGDVVAVDGGANSVAVSLLRKSYLARFVRRSWRLIRVNLLNANSEISIFVKAFEHEQDVTENQLRNTGEILLEIKSELESQGKRLYVFLIPSRSLSLIRDCCEKDNLYKIIYSYLKKNDIKSIDIKEGFEKYINQKDIFFKNDIHLTRMGHQLVAESIAATLTSE